MVDYYSLLGVSRQAGIDEIKKAYRKKAKSLHPDVNRSSTANKDFAMLNEAYATLTDPDSKRKYDLKLAYGDFFARRPAEHKAREEHQKKEYRKRYGNSAANSEKTASSNYYRSDRFEPRSGESKSRISPVLMTLFFATGMFIGFLIIFLTIAFVYVRMWPFIFLLITLPGIILIREGWKGMTSKGRRGKKGRIL